MQSPLFSAAAVLYVRPGIPVCDDLMKLVENDKSITVVDIDDLPERPSWLRGVPTLVAADGGPVLKGTTAIRAIKERVRKELRPVARCRAPAAGVDWSTSDCPAEEEEGFQFGELSASAERKPVSLEEMMRLRGA